MDRATSHTPLRGTAALITGAGGAIGAATARLFHARGAHVLLADYNVDSVHQLQQELDSSGLSAVAVAYDASVPEDAHRTAHYAIEKFGRLDFLIPGAGVYLDSAFTRITRHDWEQTINVNLSGVFHLCKQAAPFMQEGGAIVTISSIAGHRGSAAHAHYAASKGGILALTRSMARELAPRLRVNAVSPGIIATPMTVRLLQERGAALLVETPLGRFGTAAEVASVIAFLCSSEASFINGEAIHVNGGLYME